MAGFSEITDEISISECAVNETNAFCPKMHQKQPEGIKVEEPGKTKRNDARQPPEDVNYEDEDEDDVTWMSHEEEDKKIIDALKEVAMKCTHANPKKRPTAFEVLQILAKVYEPPKEPFSFAECMRTLCSNEDEFEYSTTETSITKTE